MTTVPTCLRARRPESCAAHRSAAHLAPGPVLAEVLTGERFAAFRVDFDTRLRGAIDRPARRGREKGPP